MPRGARNASRHESESPARRRFHCAAPQQRASQSSRTPRPLSWASDSQRRLLGAGSGWASKQAVPLGRRLRRIGRTDFAGGDRAIAPRLRRSRVLRGRSHLGPAAVDRVAGSAPGAKRGTAALSRAVSRAFAIAQACPCPTRRARCCWCVRGRLPRRRRVATVRGGDGVKFTRAWVCGA